MPVLGELYERFEPVIRGLPPTVSDKDLAVSALRLHRAGKLEIYYAPMDWLRPGARIAIVGITPGRDTMRIAYQTLIAGLAQDRPQDEVLDEVKLKASFSGFRTQLTEWLSWLGVYRYLGIDDRDDPWTHGAQLLQPTSAVRYPVFVDGRNYSGRSPDLVKEPILRGYVLSVLAPELAEIPEALVVPLGDKVSDSLELLGAAELIDLERCLTGFPHPSGNNGHRMRKWAENREELKRKTRKWLRTHPA